MDDGRETHLRQHQRHVTCQDEDLDAAPVPGTHAPVPLRERQYDGIEQHEVPHHHDPLDDPIRLIIAPGHRSIIYNYFLL